MAYDAPPPPISQAGALSSEHSCSEKGFVPGSTVGTKLAAAIAFSSLMERLRVMPIGTCRGTIVFDIGWTTVSASPCQI